MKLKAIYDNESDIPSQFRELYTERNGKFELTGIEGVKTQGDVDRVQTALDSERTLRKTAEAKVKGLGEDFDAEAHQKIVDENEDLKLKIAATGDDASEEDIKKRIDAAVAIAVRPLERQLATANEDNTTHLETIGTQRSTINRGLIMGDVSGVLANKDLGINPDALPDIELYAERVMQVGEDGTRVTKDGVGVTPGLSLEELIKEMRTGGKRNHWFGKTVGTGSNDGDGGNFSTGKNPFSEKHWNVTEAGNLIQNNPALAKSLAEQAGGKGLQLYNGAIKAA